MTHGDIMAIILAGMAGGFSVLGIWLGKKIDRTHELVNSRMSELLDLTRKASKAEGVLEGGRDSAGLPG